MATVFSHPVVALASVPCIRGIKRKYWVVVCGVLLTILPDFDVISFKFGIPYNHVLGHRGISHSVIAAFFVSGLFTIANKQSSLGKNFLVWGYLFACALSHGLLDAATNGGLGAGLFLPFSTKRLFFEYRPIEVSPLSVERLFNGQGISVLQSEILYVWLFSVCISILLHSIVGIIRRLGPSSDLRTLNIYK